jgi:hypothetical protein
MELEKMYCFAFLQREKEIGFTQRIRLYHFFMGISFKKRGQFILQEKQLTRQGRKKTR